MFDTIKIYLVGPLLGAILSGVVSLYHNEHVAFMNPESEKEDNEAFITQGLQPLTQ
jgi:hypothetical protein